MYSSKRVGFLGLSYQQQRIATYSFVAVTMPLSSLAQSRVFRP